MRKFFKIIIAIILVITASYITNCFNNTTIDEYKKLLEARKDSIEVILEQNKKLQIRGDSISSIIVSTTDSIDKLKNKVAVREQSYAKLKQKNDSLYKEIMAGDTLTCSNCINLVEGYKIQIDSLEKIVVDKDSIIRLNDIKYSQLEHLANLNLTRAINAENELTKVLNLAPPKDPDKLFGIIKLPSREIVFFAGAVVGATIIYVQQN